MSSANGGERGSGKPGEDLWALLERSAAAQRATSTANNTPEPNAQEDSEESKRKWRRFRRSMDVVATAWWLYAATKLFVFDVDESLFGPVSGYRSLLLLGAICVVAVVWWKWSAL